MLPVHATILQNSNKLFKRKLKKSFNPIKKMGARDKNKRTAIDYSGPASRWPSSERNPPLES
jgi:hypothetical protein